MQELWFLRSACFLMLIDIYMKFRAESLNSFQVIERTGFRDRVQGKSDKKYTCKSYGSYALHSACRLMLIDIYMKFPEDSLNGFQVIEQTRLCDRVQGK